MYGGRNGTEEKSKGAKNDRVEIVDVAVCSRKYVANG